MGSLARVDGEFVAAYLPIHAHVDRRSVEVFPFEKVLVAAEDIPQVGLKNYTVCEVVMVFSIAEHPEPLLLHDVVEELVDLLSALESLPDEGQRVADVVARSCDEELVHDCHFFLLRSLTLRTPHLASRQ